MDNDDEDEDSNKRLLDVMTWPFIMIKGRFSIYGGREPHGRMRHQMLRHRLWCLLASVYVPSQTFPDIHISLHFLLFFAH